MTGPKSKNLTWHTGRIHVEQREKLLRQKGCVVWMTGLSGSGKSTLAYGLEEKLVRAGHVAFVLDGDNVRHGLNQDLGFSPEDRDENIRRIGQVAALFAQAGVMVITAFISPYRQGRQAARDAVSRGRFFEVFLDVPLSECERRDPKGLYEKARAGQISDFTGIDAPYEAPEQPEVILPTQQWSPEQCVQCLYETLAQHGMMNATTQS